MTAANVIVVAVIILIAGLILFSLCRRLFGKETCCGTKREKLRPKKLKKVNGRVTIGIEGMHCASCVSRLMKALNAMDGISAKVSLSHRNARLLYEEELDLEKVRREVEGLGFRMTDGK